MSQGGKRSNSKIHFVPSAAEHQLLECIRHAQRQYLQAADSRTLFSELLNNVLTLTDSGFGFIAEVFQRPDGMPYMKCRALTNIAWDKPAEELYRYHALQGLEFTRLDSLYGAVLTGRVAVISNEPSNDPRGCGLPAGHPPLNSFLGLPLLCGDHMVGVVGVADRAEGYDQALIDYLAPLLETTTLLIRAYRNQIDHGGGTSPAPSRMTGGVREDRLPPMSSASAPTVSNTAAAVPATLLHDIAAAFSVAAGDQLYAALARALTQLLPVDVAFISLLNAEGDVAEAVAFCDRGRLLGNFRYPLAGTPCGDALATYPRSRAVDLAAAFPHHELVRQHGLTGYLAMPFANGDGRVLGLVAVAQRRSPMNISVLNPVLCIFAARIAAEVAHRTTSETVRKLSLALDHTADAVMITDHATVIEYVNPAFTAMTGFGADEVLGKQPALVKSEAGIQQRLLSMTATDRPVRDVFINRRKSGELFYEEKTVMPLKDSGGMVTHYIFTAKDITERMQTEERLHRLVYYDDLTSLPNRRLFLERLSHALARSANGAQLAVLCLDVDHLKVINDTLGLDFGDKTLLSLARLLEEACHPGDTVARLDGDAFAALFANVASEAEVLVRVNGFLTAASQVLRIESYELYATLGIGIALAPADGADAETLLSHADAALHRAKQQGRHAYHFYSADLSARASRQLDMETRLRRAVERSEFHLYYQPQIDLVHGHVLGVEALLRWQPPEGRLIGPESFIPALEDTGLILSVGEWVLRTACEQAAEWLARGVPPLRLSVNVSGRQLMQRDFLPFLRRLLDEFAFPAPLLELEITESVLMQDDPVTHTNLEALREMGVRLAIDDFGTGYSSLGYLKRFSVEALKIDRSFVRDVAHSKDDAAIITAIIAIAHSLGLDVIAEGIETPEQLRMLRLLGCRISQGFLFSPPVSGLGLIPLLQPAR